jgi:hypothetical protein
MIAAWYDDRWIIGFDVENYPGGIPEEFIIRNVKCLIYNQYKDSQRARRVQEQLKAAGQSAEQLLTEIIRYVWNDALVFINGTLLRDLPDAHEYQPVVYFAVPQMATPEAGKQLAAAAEEAGLPGIRFVFEPMAAASCILEELLRSTSSQRTQPAYVSHPTDTRGLLLAR